MNIVAYNIRRIMEEKRSEAEVRCRTLWIQRAGVQQYALQS